MILLAIIFLFSFAGCVVLSLLLSRFRWWLRFHGWIIWPLLGAVIGYAIFAYKQPGLYQVVNLVYALAFLLLWLALWLPTFRNIRAHGIPEPRPRREQQEARVTVPFPIPEDPPTFRLKLKTVRWWSTPAAFFATGLTLLFGVIIPVFLMGMPLEYHPVPPVIWVPVCLVAVGLAIYRLHRIRSEIPHPMQPEVRYWESEGKVAFLEIPFVAGKHGRLLAELRVKRTSRMVQKDEIKEVKYLHDPSSPGKSTTLIRLRDGYFLIKDSTADNIHHLRSHLHTGPPPDLGKSFRDLKRSIVFGGILLILMVAYALWTTFVA